MSKLCKLMIFVVVFGFSFLSNAFADEATAVAPEVAKDESAVAVDKDVETKKDAKHHHVKKAKKAVVKKEESEVK